MSKVQIAEAVWSDELLTGIQWIDKQHKNLVERIARLFSAMEQGRTTGEVLSVLRFLEQYTVHHFLTEETYMEEHKYPLFEDHKNEHRILKKNIELLIDNLAKLKSSDKLESLVQSQLWEWYQVHINIDDKRFADFVRKVSKQ